ncbi:MAG: inositol-3-phosphate synthase [Nitrososphaerales archaeon]
MPKIKVAIIGVGNVASALVQSTHSKKLPGLWHKRVGGYNFNDVEIVAAFDMDKRKIGLELSEAIFRAPNVGQKFAKVPRTKVVVKTGIVKDAPPAHIADSTVSTDTIVEDLKESGATIALNLIPSGMPKTSVTYARQCLEAGVSFVNATPSLVATKADLQRKFKKAKLVLAGDDLMSQFGGTAFHKGILDFINSRGIKIEKSYQLDVGGGNETLNTISEDVKIEKRDIKTEAIAAEIPYKFATVAGTTDYVDYMGDNRTSYFWMAAKGVFGSNVEIDVYLRTNDGANAVNVLLDVIRAVSYSQKRKQFGSPYEISNYGFKKLARPVLLHSAYAEFNKKYVK